MSNPDRHRLNEFTPHVVYSQASSKTKSSSDNSTTHNNETVKKKNRQRPRKKKKNSVVEHSSSSTPKAPSNKKNVAITDSSDLGSSSTCSTPSTSKANTVRDTVKKYSAENIPSEVISKVSFKIERVNNSHTAGKFIRYRCSNFKYINIKSFITAKTKLPYTFCTTDDNTITRLHKKFKGLKLNEKSQKNSQRSSAPKVYPKPVRRQATNEEVQFPDYITRDDVDAGLKDGSLIRGFMRINPRNARDSYVSNEDTSKADYYLTTVLDRNRALDGDEVILKIKPENEWIDGKKTVCVVYIMEKVHSRVCVGNLKQLNQDDFATFQPRDKRCPILRIPDTCLPNGFKQNPKQFKTTLFAAKIIRWTTPQYALGAVTECLGQSGNLKVETLSILKEFCLNIEPFSEEMKKDCLYNCSNIPPKEFTYREDLRKECIFTIDPETARDLDDAVSVKSLINGNYEVGVHISDASFYLEEGTELDQLVSRKATTIYMVNEAYHMLPIELCLSCSLLPGEDKLAFSVIWEMTAEGEVISKRFARTIINSCSKLAYEHAQMVIENAYKREFNINDFPKIYNGFKTSEIVSTIQILHKMATNLRQKRIENGSLKIDQVKLSFKLDPITGEPLEFWKQDSNESHHLIEEFMLLANISVAEKIHECFPKLAFLRCHEPPKHTMLVDLQNSLATCGIHIDISSSGRISASLKKYVTNDFAGVCRSSVLNHLTAKALIRARYFCAASVESELDFKHYALSVPIYTHFTSPIRRYADIMVHRLLAASLDYEEKPNWSVDYITAVAANCNMQKYNAKRAGEASCELFLSHYVSKNQPFVEDCVVVDVKERSFDAIVLKTGSIVRIYSNNCESGTTWKTEGIPIQNGNSKADTDKIQRKLTITFPRRHRCPPTKLIVEIFTLVKVNLERKSNSYKLEGVLLRPIPTINR